ncbi:hypothetical protein [Ureaplasma ceti]|uniref:Transposase n=1 Tax=Ureaplasma ceti TaxID=3119530 RepID=A0ABP9U6A1_9BACT
MDKINLFFKNKKTNKHLFNSQGAYLSAAYSRYLGTKVEELYKKSRTPHTLSKREVSCPKCRGKLKIYHDNENDHYYKCDKCNHLMSFSEYQKRFITKNWDTQIKNGITLYSWDGTCPNCGQVNPFLSYCINENFGTEELCEYDPILLGCVPKLDGFIMKMCRAINKFPNTKGELSARIFCSKCDAPVPYRSLIDSFLSQKTLDVEFVIKKEILINKLNLYPEDVSRTMNYLVLLNQNAETDA